MDIRTRLSLALVFVSLLSMAILGTFAYTTSAALLQEISLRQLDALAESKKRDLIKVYDSWEDILRLVRVRSELRYSIRELAEHKNDDARNGLERIIQGIATAGTDIDKIIVLDLEGNEIASAGRSTVTHSKVPVGEDISYVGTFPDETGALRVALNTGVRLDGKLIGGLELVIDAKNLFDVTGDYTGLGQTGEAFLVMRKDGDLLQILNPLRHENKHRTGEVMMKDASEVIQQVFMGDMPALEEHIDYRGESVWSATRLLPELGWGLVVKVDVSEEGERAAVLREALFDIAVALSAFAIIGGALLGFYLAKPIHDLAVVVERMRHGEGNVRAEVNSDDEIGYLAESLNELMDHLEKKQNSSKKDA